MIIIYLQFAVIYKTHIIPKNTKKAILYLTTGEEHVEENKFLTNSN